MRSYLLVPGDQPKQLEKALASGADALVVDLEGKDASARKTAASFFAEARATKKHPRLIVRVNALSSGLIDDDLDAVMAAHPDAILLPKAEGGASVVHLDAKLAVQEALHDIAEGTTKIIAQATDTAHAMFSGASYRGASARLAALAWGAEDLALELGAEQARDAQGHLLDPYRLARSICLIAASAAGIPAIDSVYADIHDKAGFRSETEAGRRDGFSGRLAIDPAQNPVINEIYPISS